ncbi:hypothetical protein DSM110093_00218 [Sulfitobacter sp. DSM 110093]|uniref:NACHT domain-containing protein n=1 Tax=Sulfitobacter sp. DSM 110093 TaxID=2883127 RepID=UPI001FAD7389|nr:NACHT domain-containing protein [Sulfitobacter sp. DSM 110093]UOA30470.1 hypothetical protein DSM110093_00218 [Sulfitobacter sp. DSM 110093]
MAAEAGILAQIGIQGFAGLLSNMATAYTNKKIRKITESSEVIKRDLRDHLQISFNKCMTVKTILKSDTAAKTLEIYVDQYFKLGDEEVDQYSMIEFIRSGQSSVIIGEGGGGKSMFMRYLWLSYFEKSDGKIPFFLELRNLNSLTHKDISDFIFHSIVKSGSTIPQADFKSALRAGEFVLFLDGFDEVSFDRRDHVQSMILELQENNPELTIVVTSRSDERFMGWENFRQAHVCPLTEEASKLLIQRANCDEDLKRKFLSKFDNLYSDHSDFLSNPLLAYMMLVTFSYNPDIPNKMFQFYEQAFEALYHRHDLTKGYKRKFHVELDKFDFIRLTSYLCLKTYYDQTVEFSRGDLLSAVEAVKGIESVSIDADAFVDDLVQSVCILKMEGLTYTFTHRSFQEYFAAHCIARIASRNLDTLFSVFSKRHSDKVLSMVADINPDLFREKFLIPNHKKFSSFIDRKSERNLAVGFGCRIGATFRVLDFQQHTKSRSDRRAYNISIETTGDMADFYHAVMAVVDRKTTTVSEVFDKNDAEFVEISRAYSPFGVADIRIDFGANALEFTYLSKTGGLAGGAKEEAEVPEESKEILIRAFRNSGMNEYLERRARSMIDFVKGEALKHQNVTGAFSDLF